MSDELEELRDSVDSLMPSTLVCQVQAEVLLRIIEKTAERAGLSFNDGQSIRDWFQRQKIEQLQRALISIEDSSPAAAAHLQKQIDESERRLRGKEDAK